jgi:hypothetical protein
VVADCLFDAWQRGSPADVARWTAVAEAMQNGVEDDRGPMLARWRYLAARHAPARPAGVTYQA